MDKLGSVKDFLEELKIKPLVKCVCTTCKLVCTPNENGKCPQCNKSLINCKSKSEYRRLAAVLEIDVDLFEEEN